MKTIILSLLLAVPIVAQESHVIKEYDRFEDRTKYWTTRSTVSHGLDLMAHFSFKGQGAGHEISGFYLIFVSTAPDWRYLKDSRLYCLIDNERVDLGSAKARDNDVRAGYSSVEVKEILMYPVKFHVLQKLSLAKRVDVRLGRTEFHLDPYFRESVKQLLGKIQTVKAK